MTDAESDFLKEGINRYPEACAILDTFRSLAANRVATLLGQSLKARWPAFAPAGVARIGQRGRPHFGEKTGFGRWVFATCEGGVRNSPMTRVEAGMWWNVPWDPQETIFYLRCYNVNEMGLLTLESPHPTVSFQPDEKVLYLKPGEPPDFEGAIAQLVEVVAHATIRFPDG